MQEIIWQIGQLLSGLLVLLQFIGMALIPWIPLIAWVAFWMFAVNWTKLREVIFKGAWIGLVLAGLVWVLVWGTIAPPRSGSHGIFGLALSNYVGKMVYVTMLFCIMLLCGAAQRSGFCASWLKFEGDENEEAAAAAHR